MSYAGLPPSWEVRHSSTKNLPYYFNPSTKESRWEPPVGTDTAALKSYMATQHSSSHHKDIGQAAVDDKSEEKIRVRHLLIKHKDSRRASSWRQDHITRTMAEARAILEGHRERIIKGEAKLEDIAMTESDDSSARRGGDLGEFGRKVMQEPFEKAAFNLQVGELSDIVQTDSGLHLIQRIERHPVKIPDAE